MDKATEIGQTSAHGRFHLFIGQMYYDITRRGTIILQLFISERDYGLYVIALIPATTILLFQDWGVGGSNG